MPRFLPVVFYSTVGLFASAFIAYCIYFDYKRTRAPDYKKKLRQKRLKQQQAEKQTSSQQMFIDLSNPAAREALLKSEYETGMTQLAEKNSQEAVTHFMNVVQLAPDPVKMVSVFKQILPPELFFDMMQQFQQMSQHMSQQTPSSSQHASNGGQSVALD